jgi:hypothetical protein
MKKGIVVKVVIAGLLVGLGVGGWFYDKQQKEAKIAKEKHDTPHWELVSTDANDATTFSAYFPPTIITYSDLIKKDVYARKVWVKSMKERVKVKYSIVILCDENSYKVEERLAYSSSDELLFKLPTMDKFETPPPDSNMDYVLKATCAY